MGIYRKIKLKAKTEGLPVSTPFREILEMRNEITDLKKDVKEMLRLMNALYDFKSEYVPVSNTSWSNKNIYCCLHIVDCFLLTMSFIIS